MKQRGCKSCHLLKPVSELRDGLCPNCWRPPAPAAIAAEPKPQPKDETVERLRSLLSEYTRPMPQIWRAIDELRAERGKKTRDWPSWCFLPVSILMGYTQALQVATGLKQKGAPIDPTESSHLQALAMLAAWRTTQGIYRFDPEILSALWETPVTGELPTEVLRSLPEWCVYIETPGRALRTGEKVYGFFATLDYVNEKVEHLRLVIDTDGPLKLLPIEMRGTLAESLAEMERDHKSYIDKYGSDAYVAAARAQIGYSAEDLEPLVSVLLYLCSQNAEVRDRSERRLKPSRPSPTQTKQGPRFFPPDQPTTWECGWRTGAAIRAAREAENRRSSGEGTHARPRPHIRRAHWHSFWTGQKAKVGVAKETERKLVLHWLPPIPVNVSDDAQVVPTIHEVEKRGEQLR